MTWLLRKHEQLRRLFSLQIYVIVEIMNLQKKQSYNKALLLILLTAVLGAGAGVLIKIVVREIPPISFTFLRFLVASFFALPFLLKQKHHFDKHFLRVLAISLLGTGNVTLYALGIASTQANIAQTLYSISPIIVAVLSFYLYKERCGLKKISGIALGLFGAFLIVLLPVLTKGALRDASLSGNLIVFFAVISFTFYIVLSQHLQKRFSPNYITSLFIVLTTIILLPFTLHDAVMHPFWWKSLSLNAIFLTFLIGSLGTYGLYVLSQYAVKHGNPVIATSSLYIQPAVAFYFAYLLLGEQITVNFFIGVVLVFIGAWITTRAK
jgi:drug/metabolite transporter (DMT)-like permease